MITAAVVSSFFVPRIRPVGFSSVSSGSPSTCGMTATPVSKPERPSASFGKTSRATPIIANDVAVLGGQRRGPVGDDMPLGDHVPEADDHDHDVERQVDAHQDDGDADRLQEALEEHRAEQGEQDEGDQHLLAVQGAR